MKVPSMSSIQRLNSGMCVPKVVHYSTIGLWNFIANDITNLDVMKITSSHIALLLQSHRNASYMIPLSCIMYDKLK
jgi:hypothetical protein